MMDRRKFLSQAAAVAAGTQLLPAISVGDDQLAAASDAGASNADVPPAGSAEHVIFIWLGGGMAQIDTFDPKRRGSSRDRRPGSDYAAIPTAVPDVQVCEHLRRTADRMDRVTAVRTVHHDMIDEHAAAVYWVHVGRPVNGTIQYPALGAVVGQQLGSGDPLAPAYTVIGYPNMARSPGFLGPKHGYLHLTDLQSGPRGLVRPAYVDDQRQQRRLQLLNSVRNSQLAASEGPGRVIDAYDQALLQSRQLGSPEFMSVFDLQQESDDTREMYGSEFGQRCLLARRLTERGVRFVEVAHNLNFVNGTGWDTHKEGQLHQWTLIQELDQALAALIDDLETRRRLDKTLIVVASEFGRPAEFDSAGGRGHQSTAFSVVLAGGGLKHSGAIGRTDEMSKRVVEQPVSIPDFHATVHHALGIDYHAELYDVDRPVPITDNGRPVAALFG